MSNINNNNKYLSQIKVSFDKSEHKFYLMSECMNGSNDRKYELLLFSSTHSNCNSLEALKALKGVIDFDVCETTDSEWNERQANDKSKESQTIEALRHGSKPLKDLDSEQNCSYNYEMSLTAIDVNNDLYVCQLFFCMNEFDEQIAKIPVLSLDVQKVDSTLVMSEVMHKMLELFESKEQLIEKLNSENESLRENFRKSVESLDYFTVKKEENDSILFTKFVSILNEKKDKIRELERQLNAN